MTEVRPVNQPLPRATPEKWATETVASLCEFVRDGDWIETKDQGGDAFRLLQISNIGVGRFVETGNFRSISLETFRRLNCTELAVGDVLVARMPEPTGRAWWIDRLPWRAVTAVDVAILRPKANVLDGRYLSYFLNSPACLRFVDGLTTGTTRMRVKRRDLEALHVPVPALPVQRRIAEILGALDDKIELNRRLSETLQATARALFKSWYVAKAGTEADGWHSRTIGDLAEVVGGSTPSTAEPRYWGGSHFWATPKDLAGLRTPVLLRTERMLTDAGIGQISSGLLPAGTVLMSSRAPIGYLAITEVPVAVNQGFIAMKPRPGVSGLFLLHWAASSQDQILSRANGSTFLEISKSSFRPIEVHAPPADAMASFDRFVGPIHERVVANERQIGMLAEIRDALLPRLLTGQLTP